MDLFFSLGGVPFCFRSDRVLHIGSMFTSFLTEEAAPNAVKVCFIWDWSRAELPAVPLSGKDILLDYYIDGRHHYCLCDGAAGPQSCVSYTSDCKVLTCVLNVAAFPGIRPDISLLIRYLPMREILLKNGVIFFHASQIAAGQKGILFSAPSGTGKTTQAKLWKQFRGVRIICNDRTLVRKTEAGWRTYGYPFDGSEPVSSNEIHRMGAVVMLEQAPENTVMRVGAVKALTFLMRQVVIDTWNPQAVSMAIDLLTSLIAEVPVYLLQCRPDIGAVDCLDMQLRKDGVL